MIKAKTHITNIESMVEGGGFEPPKLTRQIYNLIPLAAREPLQNQAGNSEAKPSCDSTAGAYRDSTLRPLIHSTKPSS